VFLLNPALARASVHMRVTVCNGAMIHQAVQVIRKPAPTAEGGERSFAAYMAQGKEQAVDNFVGSWLSQVDWPHLNPLALSTMVDVTCPPYLSLLLGVVPLRVACCTGVGCSTARGDGGALSYAADSAGADAAASLDDPARHDAAAGGHDATATAAGHDATATAAGHDATATAASHADADPAAAAGGHDATAAAGHDSSRLRRIQCTADDRPVRAARRVLPGLLCSTYISSKWLKCAKHSFQYMLFYEKFMLVGVVLGHALMFSLNNF
jgi:hypothetical protein